MRSARSSPDRPAAELRSKGSRDVHAHQLANGTTKPIADVKVGDQVEATDPTTGKTSAHFVTAVKVHDDRDLMDVSVKAADGQTGVLHTNAHHIFWDDSKHEWLRVDQLQVGDRLVTSDGAGAQVSSLVAVPGHQRMWDLSVEGIHSFYVETGHGAVLVHNDGPGWIEVTGGRSIPAPGKYVEYLWDPATGRVVISAPSASPFDHTTLAAKAGMPADSLGGTLSPDGTIMDESSGHFNEGWTDELRAKFQQQLNEEGFSIEKTTGFEHC